VAERGLGAGLVVLGGALTAISCFADLYTTYEHGPVPSSRSTISLWGGESGLRGIPEVNTVVNTGVPVVVATALMVVAAVLTVPRLPRINGIARVTTMVAAGALAGIVLAFVVGALHEEELMSPRYGIPGYEFQVTYLPGLYLLVAGALAGLVGAVLAQRPQQPRPVDEPEGEAVVVHQLTDDDTPPFGIAVSAQTEEQRRD
jgi:hypothetical protein